MRVTKNEIKNWMKENNLERAWLAKECGVSKATVDTWLSSDRGVPSKAQLTIQTLIFKTTGKKEYGPEFHREAEMDTKFRLPVEIDMATLHKAEQEAFRRGMKLSEYCSLSVKWCANQPQVNLGEKEESSHQGYFRTVNPVPAQEAEVIGNIAAGNLEEGDTIPFMIRTDRPLGKGEYVLRVNGKSMEPKIMDGSLIVVKKYTVPPIPKVGTIVEYNDERGVTLKKLGRRKNPETGKLEYVLKPINPEYKDIVPMDGGRISGIYVTTLTNWSRI